MADDKGFEPYIDWDGVNEEMTDDLHAKLAEFRRSQDVFLADKSTANAAAVLRAQQEIGHVTEAIQRTLYTVPMMVHIAGPKTKGEDETGRTQIIQRCKRCGSVLQLWKEGWAAVTDSGPEDLEESDLGWWDEGEIVAKATQEMVSTLYVVGDRALEKHEKPCPDLAGLTR